MNTKSRPIGRPLKDRQQRNDRDYFSREAVLARMRNRDRRRSPPITTDAAGNPLFTTR